MRRLVYMPILFGSLSTGLSCSHISAKPAVNIVDDTWLEEVEGPKALAWVRQENERSQLVIESDPRYKTFTKELSKIMLAKDRIPMGTIRGNFVYNFWQDEVHVRGLWRRTTLTSYQKKNPKWETLIDFDLLAKGEKENWVFKGSQCQPWGGDRCLVQLSKGGKDASVIREFDVAQKSFVKNGFVLTEAKQDANWVDADTLLVGTDWGPGSMTKSGYPRIAKVWKRGQPLNSAQLLFEGKEEDVSINASTIHRPEGKVTIVTRSLDFFNAESFWISPDFATRKLLPMPTDADVLGFFKGQLIFSVRKVWTADTAAGSVTIPEGGIYSFDLAEWVRVGKIAKLDKIFVASLTQSFQGLESSQNSLFVSYFENVRGRVDRINWTADHWESEQLNLPEDGSIDFSSVGDFSPHLLLSYSSFLQPTSLWLGNETGAEFKIIKSLPARFSTRGLMVEQLWATSKDGTKIPFFVVRSSTLQHAEKTPTLIYAYGGFQISEEPHYSGSYGKVWLERGGTYVLANIRGGGEFGPRWHQAALKENRQKAFDDLIAVSEELIRVGYATPQNLAIAGGSNGGLLVGAVFNQRPDLYNAVVCQVPLLDMLNYTKFSAGPSWVGEYGDPADPVMRKVIEKYSPLQNLNPSTQYPEMFLMTSTKDDRVHPVHARKMGFALSQMGKPFSYYENIEGGHGAAANLKQVIHMTALKFTFLARKLGLPLAPQKLLTDLRGD